MRLESTFASPPVHRRALLRWWWPGGAVDAPALIDQLRAFHAGGWGGVEIQPFRVGLPHPAPADVHDVYSARWFGVVRDVMDEAERLGMTVDVTFGSCWPPGGGQAVTPALAAQELTLAWTSVRGPCTWEGRPAQPSRPLRFGTRMEAEGAVDPVQALPEEWRRHIEALSRVEAVLALCGGAPELGPYEGFVPLTLPDVWGRVHASGVVDAGSVQDLTDQLQPDGTLRWAVPPGPWQIVVVRRFVSDQRITESAGEGPQLVIDHLRQQAFDVHAARVGDAALPHWGHHAGRTWRSVFVDSLELPCDLHWTDDFADEFQRRRGYPIRPWLPLLLQPGWFNCFQARRGAALFDDADVGARVRHDYRRTLSELMVERHHGALARWAQTHGLQAKLQAHGAPVDWLAAYGSAHLPETEDLAGGAAPHFLRVARSAAHAAGRPLVTAEAFCWLLEGLAVTPRQVRERADAFFAAGIQQLIGHGASAPVQATDAAKPPGPAWYPFAAMEIGTQLDPDNPLWPMLTPLAQYMARCQTVLQHGMAVVPVAVLMPPDFFAFHSAADKLTAPPWHQALQDAGYDWDWINGDTLLAAPVDAGTLRVPGGQRYAAIVVPDIDALTAEVAERLAACADAGIVVRAIGCVPRREAGLADAVSRDRRVQAAMARALRGAPQPVPGSQIGQVLRAAAVAPALDLAADPGLSFHVRTDGHTQRWVFLFNPTGRAAAAELRLADGLGAEQWHAWSGRIEPLVPDAAGRVRLALRPGMARILRLAPVDACAAPHAAMAAAVPSWRRAVAGPWRVQAQGRGLHGRPIAFDASWADLQDVSRLPDVADFAGCITYTAQLSLSGDDLQSGPLWLDLGEVADAASVQVNDCPPVVACEAPFLFDLHAALRPGINQLRVVVANRPENARRDPAQPGGLPLPGRRLTRLPTGLLGPVHLITATAAFTRWSLPAGDLPS